MKKRKLRVCFAASSGGHLLELMMLGPLMDQYDSFLVTEKTAYRVALKGMRCHGLLQVNRREWLCIQLSTVDCKHFLFFGNLLGGTAGRGGLHRRAGNNPPLSVMQAVWEKIGVY